MAARDAEQPEGLLLRLNCLAAELQATKEANKALQEELQRLKAGLAPTSAPHAEAVAETEHGPASSTTGGEDEHRFPTAKARRKERRREGDLSKCPVRHVALKLMYTGSGFHGFASQAGSERTVEGELFAALERTRLLTTCRADAEYSRCGRTDKGVSALGQVIALRLRSKCGNNNNNNNNSLASGQPQPSSSSSSAAQHSLETAVTLSMLGSKDTRVAEQQEAALVGASSGSVEGQQMGAATGSDMGSQQRKSSPPASMQRDRVAFAAESRKLEAHIAATADEEAEIDYVAVLNRALPTDIRILGWCPVPQGFSARFSCLSREYKYFFVPHNLNIQAMREAAAMFVGEHDFRNFCKMDAANIHNYRRRITAFSVISCQGSSNPLSWMGGGNERVGYMHVKGSAFLWHQVRCMAAVLFMVGRGEEHPSVVSRLLDVQQQFPRKPQYAMAPQQPLLLYTCSFQGLSFRCSPDALEALRQHVKSKVHECLINVALLKEAYDETESGHHEDRVCEEHHLTNRKTTHVCLDRRPTEPSYEERRGKAFSF